MELEIAEFSAFLSAFLVDDKIYRETIGQFDRLKSKYNAYRLVVTLLGKMKPLRGRRPIPGLDNR